MGAGPSLGGGHAFVGRQRQLDLVVETCRLAPGAGGRCFVVRGAAGIGKTTFCEQVAARARDIGLAVDWGRCWPGGGTPPMWPWPEVLRDLDPHVRGLTLSAHDVERDRFARFSAVGDAIATRSHERPQLIVLDDAQFADTAALLLARFLSRTLAAQPVVLLVTRRTGDVAGMGEPVLDELERDALVIELGPFDVAETSAFLAAHGLEDDTEHRLASALVRLTRGNPYLLGRAVVHGGPPSGLAGVEQVIGDAVARLEGDHGRILAVTGLLGPSAASTSDIVDVSRAAPADVMDALDAAATSGLVELSPLGWSFTHDLVRNAAIGVLAPVEAIDLHAAAASLRADDHRPGAVARRAHHALAAATRSDADARRAIAACREAAAMLRSGLDFERACALLDSAVALAERVASPREHAEALLEWALALLMCGRLADARSAFDHAASAAERVADPVARARAALGLGGVWLNELRVGAERDRMLNLQRAALVELPADSSALRVRLRVRLGAEAVYDGAPPTSLFEAVGEARCLGDLDVLAEALCLQHHALLDAQHLELRRPFADELIAVASAAGNDLRVLFGLLWRAVDQLHAGEPLATRSLRELRERADAVGCRSITYVAEAIDVMQLIRDGRLADAERAADRCFELGIEVGDADATAYYGAHLLTIRWLQDRDRELLALARDLASSATLVGPEFAMRAAAIVIAARAGATDEAVAQLRTLTRDGLDALPVSSTWLMGICLITEAAALLGDAGVASEACGLLAPFADRPAMPSLGVTCFGAVERYLGLAALAIDDAASAVAHFERAVARDLELGNRPLTAVTRADLATALVARDVDDDRARAIECWRQAVRDALEIGMDARAASWLQAADAHDRPRRPTGALYRSGDRWTIEADGRRVDLPDLVGVAHLGLLLSRPGDFVAAVELCGGTDVGGVGHDLVDHQTLVGYRRRVEELDSALVTARAGGPSGRVRRLEAERTALRDELSSVLAIGGRTRRFVDAGERARTAVRKAITRVLDTVAQSDVALAGELRATITTGRACSYMPDPARPRCWTFEP